MLGTTPEFGTGDQPTVFQDGSLWAQSLHVGEDTLSRVSWRLEVEHAAAMRILSAKPTDKDNRAISA